MNKVFKIVGIVATIMLGFYGALALHDYDVKINNHRLALTSGYGSPEKVEVSNVMAQETGSNEDAHVNLSGTINGQPVSLALNDDKLPTVVDGHTTLYKYHGYSDYENGTPVYYVRDQGTLKYYPR